MKHLIIDYMYVQDDPHLARLMWPDDKQRQRQLDLNAYYYSVPKDHANIAFIACRIPEAQWADLPVTSHRQPLAFLE